MRAKKETKRGQIDRPYMNVELRPNKITDPSISHLSSPIKVFLSLSEYFIDYEI